MRAVDGSWEHGNEDDLYEAAARTAEQLAEVLRRLGGAGPTIGVSEVLEPGLVEVLKSTGPTDELQRLADLLHAWTRRPNDLMVMARLAQDSEALERALRALLEARRLLEDRSIQ